MVNTNSDFREAVNFEDDFGPTPEGRLLQKLGLALRGDTGTSYITRIQKFYNQYKNELHVQLPTQPMYGLALLRIASVIGDQELYDEMTDHCLKNYLPWQHFEGGHEVYQKRSKQLWLKDSVGQMSNCKGTLYQKIALYEALAIDARETYIHSEIEGIGLAIPSVRKRCLQSIQRIAKTFPNDAFIATALVVLTQDPNERKELAFQMYERFPDHDKLRAITDDVNAGQPGYKNPKRRMSPLYT